MNTLCLPDAMNNTNYCVRSSSTLLCCYDVRLDRATGHWRVGPRNGIPEYGGFVAVNGVRSSVAKAASCLGRAALAARYEEFTLVYKPSGGLLADVREASLDVLGEGSQAALTLAQWLRNSLHAGARIDLAGHSQGAAIISTAVSQLDDMADCTKRLTVSAFGAPISLQRFRQTIDSVGATLGYFKVNALDPIATVVGGNAPSWMSFLGSVLCAPLIFTPFKHPHCACSYFPEVFPSLHPVL